jgi:3-keto-disaccharide hydrolase
MGEKPFAGATAPAHNIACRTRLAISRSAALRHLLLEGDTMTGRKLWAAGGLLGLAAVAWGLSSALAAEKPAGDTFTDAAKAGPDFEVQGEYVGEIEEGGKKKAGAQVIALGDGKFEAVLYKGGLPGNGWKDGDDKTKIQGETKEGVTTFVKGGKNAKLKDGALTLYNSGGTVVGTLKKTVRKSPTLGAKPPEGATVLFDGKSADKFKGGRVVMGDLLAVGCETAEKFGDHTLHIEFRTPFMPKARGQGRGNSGVYPQGRYEVQVLDSFGLEGENNECGGIYQIAKPAVNMCYPPLSWQTYDIDFTAAKYDADGKKTKNARITVKHNGVVIHDDLELPKGTPGKDAEGPGPGALFLQDHGNPVHFRNIWVVKK